MNIDLVREQVEFSLPSPSASTTGSPPRLAVASRGHESFLRELGAAMTAGHPAASPGLVEVWSGPADRGTAAS